MNFLEHEVRCVLARFLAEVLEAVERYSIEAVQHAFRQMRGSVASSRMHRLGSNAASSTRAESEPSNAWAYDQRLTRNDLKMRAQVQELLRHHPGLGTKELAHALNLKTDQCRRFVDGMALANKIRFDEVTVRGLRRRAYYVVDGIERVLGAEPVCSTEAAIEPRTGAVA
jgi:hypothetical protein